MISRLYSKHSKRFLPLAGLVLMILLSGCSGLDASSNTSATPTAKRQGTLPTMSHPLTATDEHVTVNPIPYSTIPVTVKQEALLPLSDANNSTVSVNTPSVAELVDGGITFSTSAGWGSWNNERSSLHIGHDLLQQSIGAPVHPVQVLTAIMPSASSMMLLWINDPDARTLYATTIQIKDALKGKVDLHSQRLGGNIENAFLLQVSGSATVLHLITEGVDGVIHILAASNAPTSFFVMLPIQFGLMHDVQVEECHGGEWIAGSQTNEAGITGTGFYRLDGLVTSVQTVTAFEHPWLSLPPTGLSLHCNGKKPVIGIIDKQKNELGIIDQYHTLNLFNYQIPSGATHLVYSPTPQEGIEQVAWQTQIDGKQYIGVGKVNLPTLTNAGPTAFDH